MKIKFGSYISKDFWQFSIGITLWKGVCYCHEWCFTLDLGFCYVEVYKDKLK